MQLRDRSAASRGVWRPGCGRGRALFGPRIEGQASTYGPAQDFVAGGVQATISPTIPLDRSNLCSQETASPQSGRDSSPVGDLTDDLVRFQGLQDATQSSTSSVSSCTTKVSSLRHENFHGTSSTAASSTPPPSSASAPPSFPVAPYPMNVGYFTPQPWAQSYAPPYPYAVPVVPGCGYAGYPYPSIHPLASTVFTREASLGPTATLSGGAWAPPIVDKMYKVCEFKHTARIRLTTAIRQDTTSCNTSRPPGHVNSQQSMVQPPLRATGFIQNEHGTLIPVYQREALDQYMANSHGRQVAPSPSETLQPGPTSAPAGGTTWQPPAALPMCPGSFPVNMPAGVAVASIAPPVSLHPPIEQRFWTPGSLPYGVATLPASSHTPNLTPLLPASVVPASSRAPPSCRPHRNGPPPRRLARRDYYHAQGNSQNGPQTNMTEVDYARPSSRSYDQNVHHYRRPQTSGC